MHKALPVTYAPTCNATDSHRELTGDDYNAIASVLQVAPSTTDEKLAELLGMDVLVVSEGRRVLEEKGLSLFDERDPHGLEWAAGTAGPTDGEIGRARFRQMLGALQKGSSSMLARTLQDAMTFDQRKNVLLSELDQQIEALAEQIEGAEEPDRQLIKERGTLVKQRIALFYAKAIDVQDLVRILTATSDSLRLERGEPTSISESLSGGKDPATVKSLIERLREEREAVESGRMIPGVS
jgi:hypothetical protein